MTLVRPEQLFETGRYSEALAAIDGLSGCAQESIGVLRAELLERTGQYQEADRAARRLIGCRDLSLVDQSRCEFVLGLTCWSDGDADKATIHFQRAVNKAKSSGDIKQICRSQLRLMVVLADRSGVDATDQLFVSARENITRAGDARLTAALHIFVGEINAKRGLLDSAVKHTCLGLRLIEHDSSLWLEAMAANTLAAVGIMKGDLAEAESQASRARDLSRRSGAAAMHHAALGNLANVSLQQGRFTIAAELFKEASAILPKRSLFTNSSLESLARTAFMQGETSRAHQYLDEIENSIRSREDALLYPNRHATLTAIELAIAERDMPRAQTLISKANALARETKDRALTAMCRLLEFELRAQMQHELETAASLPSLGEFLSSSTPEFVAKYEKALGRAMARHQREGATDHLSRSKRVFEALNNVAGVIEVSRDLQDCSPMANRRSPRQLIHDISQLLLFVGRPELLASAVLNIIRSTDSADAAWTVSTTDNGVQETIESFGDLAGVPKAASSDLRTFALGLPRGRRVEVIAAPRKDLESQAVLNCIALMVNRLEEFELSRTERERRLALWPLDDQVTSAGAIIDGKMTGVMSLAKRVAQTNISILITGESGTGKEVLARAVHAFSPRAKRPFIPFNCTAIPRELLESQLFGFRRGAFTGADRDSAGLIRAARDGTLFLDEIGELSLDLQPKLLRFLESGEIHPLGDAAPFNVDVRIIAATNADLAKLVQEGRFREDLYYRLDVVKLEIPPLRDRRDEIPGLAHHFIARACAEFKKERVRISEETMEHLLLCMWPGNVRQLQNEMRRMVAMADSDTVLGPDALHPDIRNDAKPAAAPAATGNEFAIPLNDKLAPTVARIEREMIRNALRANDGRLEATAKALGISRKGLYLKRQRLGV